MLSEDEKREILELSKSSELKRDMEMVVKNRQNSFIINGEVDIDKFITFLTEYNYFINHTFKPIQIKKDKYFIL